MSMRARIAAFESGQVSNANSGDIVPLQFSTTIPQPGPMDSPISPSASSFTFLKPSDAPTNTPPRSRSYSPEILGRTTSLIDVNEYVKPPALPSRPSSSVSTAYTDLSSQASSSSLDVLLINADTPSESSRTLSTTQIDVKVTPSLPPRKPPLRDFPSTSSYGSSLSSELTTGTSSSWNKVQQPVQSSASSNTFLEVRPPINPSNQSRHAHMNSTSSLQSVSLSDGESKEPAEPRPSVSAVAAAFNSISNGVDGMATGNGPLSKPSISQATLPYKARVLPVRKSASGSTNSSIITTSPPPQSPVSYPPPALPPRTSLSSTVPHALFSASSASPPSAAVQPTLRRVAPPPLEISDTNFPKKSIDGVSPLRSIDKSLEKRQAPLPLAAQKRYDKVFEKNATSRKLMEASARPSMNSGWRGLSLDNVHQASSDGKDENVGALGVEAAVVKVIWMCSKLSRATLRRIWAECDPEQKGRLEREAFARGMWAIDNELSKIAKMKYPRSLRR